MEINLLKPTGMSEARKPKYIGQVSEGDEPTIATLTKFNKFRKYRS
jgi:hypothetical protein